jgi:catechol 2,3-dioxygenase-like lactoylglutathione lyase family enzyme
MPPSITAVLKADQPQRHPSPTAKATELAYLVFERPDLDQAQRFLVDFGLRVAHRAADTLYLRGTGSSPWCYKVVRSDTASFTGFAFAVPTEVDLFRLAKVAGATGIVPIDDPGGGKKVQFRDPSGFLVEAVWDRQELNAIAHRPPLPANHEAVIRRVNEGQRLAVEPPQVIKLGHVVIEVADYQATSAWYTQHFGLIPSDVQVLPDGSPAVTFFRLDLGDVPADHHTLAMAQGFMPSYSHSAYEVVDIDAIGMGHRVLRERGRTHAWGIGRHILGSQLFDYWSDPWGNHHEHYCDGDVFTAESPTGVFPVSAQAMSQWGQVMPKSFVMPKMTWMKVQALFSNLRHSPDVTLRKLITLARMF